MENDNQSCRRGRRPSTTSMLISLGGGSGAEDIWKVTFLGPCDWLARGMGSRGLLHLKHLGYQHHGIRKVVSFQTCSQSHPQPGLSPPSGCFSTQWNSNFPVAQSIWVLEIGKNTIKPEAAELRVNRQLGCICLCFGAYLSLDRLISNNILAQDRIQMIP